MARVYDHNDEDVYEDADLYFADPTQIARTESDGGKS